MMFKINLEKYKLFMALAMEERCVTQTHTLPYRNSLSIMAIYKYYSEPANRHSPHSLSLKLN